MLRRILYIAQVGPPAFPRFVIADIEGRAWNGSSWGGHPLLYADRAAVSTDCYDLQRAEASDAKHHAVVEVPLRFETYSDNPLDLEQLRDWLCQYVSVTVDVTSGSGPTPDSIVIGSLEWPRFGETRKAS